jgi:UDP-glucose 4-epimerase
LRGKYVPMVFGFDPLFQFLHEDDLVSALVLALGKRPRGVYNVAGPQPVPLSVAAQAAGRIPLPLPEFAFALALGRMGLPRLPAGALSHIKYPVVIDGSAFRTATGFAHRFDETGALSAFVEAFPAP